MKLLSSAHVGFRGFLHPENDMSWNSNVKVLALGKLNEPK